MLTCSNINKSFTLDASARKENILIDINLVIKEKSLTALKGPSGSGKSTLLNLICGLDKVSSGNIIFNDLEITKMSINQLCAFRNKNIGIVFQFFNLINDLTVFENISLPLALSNEKKSTITRKTNEMISRLGLWDRRTFKTNLLSGGEAQRVAIGRSLITRPRLILADEPTGNLDKANSKKILELLIESCKLYDSSLLLVTHDDNLLSYFDNILELESGRIK